MSDSVQQLIEFLKFSSVSTDPACKTTVVECANWLVNKLVSIGLTATLYPTPGHPVVVAKNFHKPGRRTVMIYGHYDVQPVDPLELWNAPPFEPRIVDGYIFARGSADNKGQHFAHVIGVEEAIREKGDVPVNLIFLIEGEEEVTSINLEKFMIGHREELHCDIIVVSDNGMIAPRTPTFTYGLRGIAGMEVKVVGPSTDLHSGIYGGAVMNPVTALARLIATLHDANGRVAVPGFYDGIPPLEKWEREAWAKLPFGDADIVKVTGAGELFGEAGYTSIERTWARPTAEVNGIGEGTRERGDACEMHHVVERHALRLQQRTRRACDVQHSVARLHCGTIVAHNLHTDMCREQPERFDGERNTADNARLPGGEHRARHRRRWNGGERGYVIERTVLLECRSHAIAQRVCLQRKTEHVHQRRVAAHSPGSTPGPGGVDGVAPPIATIRSMARRALSAISRGTVI